MAYEEQLKLAGLTRDQAALYEALVKNGALPASRAARIAGVSRTLSYKVLGELEEKGLVTHKDEKGAVSTFTPAHPMQLKEVVEERARKASAAVDAVSSVFDSLTSDYNLVSGKPGVRLLEGVSGVAALYADVLHVRSDLCLIRSPQDDSFPELAALVAKQVAAQAQAGIRTRAITPYEEATPETVRSDDVMRLVERRIVARERFNIPAQVLIYGTKVALTSYDTYLMTSIIENGSIHATFVALFEYLWEATRAEHEQYMAAIVGKA